MERHKFEVGVYNKEVREAMRQGDRHRELKDDWADIHWIEVFAIDEEAAREKVMHRFPPERGYVITEVVRLD